MYSMKNLDLRFNQDSVHAWQLAYAECDGTRENKELSLQQLSASIIGVVGASLVLQGAPIIDKRDNNRPHSVGHPHKFSQELYTNKEQLFSRVATLSTIIGHTLGYIPFQGSDDRFKYFSYMQGFGRSLKAQTLALTCAASDSLGVTSFSAHYYGRSLLCSRLSEMIVGLNNYGSTEYGSSEVMPDLGVILKGEEMKQRGRRI
jgi:hypothetical protein